MKDMCRIIGLIIIMLSTSLTTAWAQTEDEDPNVPEELWEIRDPELVGYYWDGGGGNTYATGTVYEFGEDGRFLYDYYFTIYGYDSDLHYGVTHEEREHYKGDWRTEGNKVFVRYWIFEGEGENEHVVIKYDSFEYKVDSYGVRIKSQYFRK